MARLLKKSRRSRALLSGFLERVSSKIFSDFPKSLTQLIGNQYGVYALYKGKRLYYVGLATNLRGRIKSHLKDKHSGRWDAFSLYLVRKADHIRELESLIMRIASPAGNDARGKLRRAVNLNKNLNAFIEETQDIQRMSVFGTKTRGKTTRRQRSSRKKVGMRGIPPLQGYVKRPFSIRGRYKGVDYIAHVRKSGRIRFKATLFNSPSEAGKAAIGYGANGWLFWHFKNPQGEWVTLRELKKNKPE